MENVQIDNSENNTDLQSPFQQTLYNNGKYCEVDKRWLLNIYILYRYIILYNIPI